MLIFMLQCFDLLRSMFFVTPSEPPLRSLNAVPIEELDPWYLLVPPLVDPQLEYQVTGYLILSLSREDTYFAKDTGKALSLDIPSYGGIMSPVLLGQAFNKYN